MSAPTPIAGPSDVEDLIDTDLTYDQISVYLEHAADDNRAVNDVSQLTQYRQKRIEALLAAIKIRGYRDRSVASGDSESTSLDFEGHSLNELRSELARIDPSNQLAFQSAVDGDRKVTKTTE